MEKETLEQAAERNNPVKIRSTPFGSKYQWIPKKERQQFVNGAKWQAERMYSEADMLRFGAFMQQRHTGVKENFEHFKKK